MPGESMRKTIGVALGVSLVCSVLVSATVVSLNRMQEENAKKTRIRNVFMDLDLLREGEGIEDVRERTQRILIDMGTGVEIPKERYAETLDPEAFDLKAVAGNPQYSKEIATDKDIAGIRRMPRYMVAYLVKENDAIVKYVFHIYGRGLYSTLYGVIALGKDLKTVEGISFYEHAETPGLGGEIDNSQWKNTWKGKQAFDDSGNVRIGVLQGLVDTASPNAQYQIDGLSGATYTARGVDQLVKFWLGDDGYGPFLKRLREES